MGKDYTWDDEILFESDAESEPVTISEDEQAAGEPNPEPELETPESPVPEPAQEAVKFLTEAQVAELLDKRHLHSLVRTRLQAGKYIDLPTLERAVTDELAYLRELTGAGRPFGLAESAASSKPTRTMEKRVKLQQAACDKFLGKQ